MQTTPNKDIVDYIEQNILPRYDIFDSAHRVDHARTVIEQSLELAHHYDVNIDMVYVIAAYHDTGLVLGRDNHHINSGIILESDTSLSRWFDLDQIRTMREAVEDHRASSKRAPRSIYGSIVAEADRVIVGETIMWRTIAYGLDNYPSLDREAQWERFEAHITEKYGDGGYLKLWIPQSDNSQRLEEFRKTIRDREQLRNGFDRLFAKAKK